MADSTTLPSLTPRDLAVLNALCEDRAEHGQGVSRAEIAQIAVTRWPDRVIRRLNRAGHRVVSTGSTPQTMTYQLAGPSTSASDDGRSAEQPPAAADSSSGADVEGRLFELPSVSHHQQDVGQFDLARRPRRAA